MEALEFLKKWRTLCENRPEGNCGKECPLYYDYCPLDGLYGDTDKTLEDIVSFVMAAEVKE